MIYSFWKSFPHWFCYKKVRLSKLLYFNYTGVMGSGFCMHSLWQYTAFEVFGLKKNALWCTIWVNWATKYRIALIVNRFKVFEYWPTNLALFLIKHKIIIPLSRNKMYSLLLGPQLSSLFQIRYFVQKKDKSLFRRKIL